MTLRETLTLVWRTRKDERRIEMAFVRAQVPVRAGRRRLLHHSHVITIRGDSYRLREIPSLSRGSKAPCSMGALPSF